LWHWPALVFARFYFDRELSSAETMAVLAVVFAIATLSWKYIEQPIRRGRPVWRNMPASFPAAAAGCAVLVALALIFVQTNGLPLRVPPDVRAIDAEGSAPLAGRWCAPGDPAPPDCLLGSAALTEGAVLWGDSHALALSPAVADFVQRRHLRLREFTRSACPPVPGLDVVAPNGTAFPRCAAFNRAALDAILRDSNIRLVILEARWEVYLNEGRIRPADMAAQKMSAALDALLTTLAARNVKVLLIGNVPRVPFVPAQCYGHKRVLGRDPAACTLLPRADARAPIAVTDALIARAAARQPNDRAYFPAAALCDRSACRTFASGHVLYADAHHLSAAGAALVGRGIDAALHNWPR
jgi:hypothetical protein